MGLNSNQIILHNDYAEIVLLDKYRQEKARALVDLDSLPAVKKAVWYQRPDGYVATNNYDGNGYTYLHSVIMDHTGSTTYGDHRDGNRLDNRKSNLRIVTPTQNGMNKRIRSNNTSGRVGVHWDKTNKQWCAMICVNKKHMNLGYFDDFESAVRCREEAECTYFGEYRPASERVSK